MHAALSSVVRNRSRPGSRGTMTRAARGNGPIPVPGTGGRPDWRVNPTACGAAVCTQSGRFKIVFDLSR